MAILDAMKRFGKPISEGSTIEQTQANQPAELSRLAKILERALPEKDRHMMGHLFRGSTRERLCLLLQVSVDELKREVARVRWKFKEIVERHGFHRSENAEVQRFIKRTYSVLSH